MGARGLQAIYSCVRGLLGSCENVLALPVNGIDVCTDVLSCLCSHSVFCCTLMTCKSYGNILTTGPVLQCDLAYKVWADISDVRI